MFNHNKVYLKIILLYLANLFLFINLKLLIYKINYKKLLQNVIKQYYK